MSRFQAVTGQLSNSVVRANGFVDFARQPNDTMVFQLVGNRARISRAPGVQNAPAVQLVFISRRGILDEVGLTARLVRCRVDHTG